MRIERAVCGHAPERALVELQVFPKHPARRIEISSCAFIGVPEAFEILYMDAIRQTVEIAIGTRIANREPMSAVTLRAAGRNLKYARSCNVGAAVAPPAVYAKSMALVTCRGATKDRTSSAFRNECKAIAGVSDNVQIFERRHHRALDTSSSVCRFDTYAAISGSVGARRPCR